MQTALEAVLALVRDLLGDVVFKSLAALTGGLFLGLFDWGGMAIKALFFLVCMDFALGLARAWFNRRVSYAKLRRGFGKFLLYMLAILAANCVDQAAEPLVHVNFRAFVVLYLALCDALSIFKHLHCFGVSMPKAMMSRLETLRDCDLPATGKTKESK